MPHGPTRFPSKGRCIYCGRSDLPLADEHVVPFALGGQHIIAAASCRECAAITSRFEGDVSRGLWGDARNSYRSPSRRKKLRAKNISIPDPANPQRRVAVPYSDYPAPMVFYRMGQAGLLQGLTPTADVSSSWRLVAISDEKRHASFKANYGVPLVGRFRHVPESFARMIAKIGYCHTLTLLDQDDFRPLCLPYILGQLSNPSFIVGGKLSAVPPESGLGYVLNTAVFGDAHRIILLAEVRLFANNHTPMYHVVVGEVRGATEITRVVGKLGDIKRSQFLAGADLSSAGIGRDHWLPQIWPLPDLD